MRARRNSVHAARATTFPPPPPPGVPLLLAPLPSNDEVSLSPRIIWYQSMTTRSGPEFRTGTNTAGSLEEMPDWAKALVRSVEEFRRTQDETKTQLKFLMAQILDLKTERLVETPIHATTFPAEPSLTRVAKVREEEPQWDAAKRGAKPEVMVFDGSLDPKKYMDWEVGLEEYFKWFQLPENRRVQFAQMKLAGQARIYWRNLQATAERRREPPVSTWEEMKSRMRGKFVPACYRPMIIDEWQHLRQGTVP